VKARPAKKPRSTAGGTFWIIHKSELGPVMECKARKTSKGWSVLVRPESCTWDFVKEMCERESLADLKLDHTLIEGEWPDER
jgi:hypothetical protein